MEAMHREISDMMDFVDDDIRREFEKRLRAMFSEE